MKESSRLEDGSDWSGIAIQRNFAVPRIAVFQAWTNPELLRKWWGPKAFTTPECTVDLRAGGKFHYCMRSQDGTNYWGIGVYREILEPCKLVYADSFADEQGNPVAATHYGMNADWPMETLVEVGFEEQEGQTLLTLRHATGGVPDSEIEMCRQGWEEMLDKLNELMGGQGLA